MTFAIVLASHTAIWACADRKLLDNHSACRSTSSGVKITVVETTDGVALVTYAGIGRVNDTQVSQWVYQTLRGLNMPLEQSLEHVAAAARRRIATYIRSAKTPHIFLASAICGGKHFIYTIDPIENGPLVRRHQPRGRDHVIMGMSGSGARYLRLGPERARVSQISRMIKQYKRGNVSPVVIAKRLASLNLAVHAKAREANDNTVSAECIVAHRLRNGPTTGGQHWCFDSLGRIYDGVMLPVIAHGWPVPELAVGVMREMARLKDSLPKDAIPQQLGTLKIMDDETTKRIQAAVPNKPDDEFT